MPINAFVGHSFISSDSVVVRRFLDFFDLVSSLGIDFKWDHAEAAEPKELSIKVKEKMEGKNLFIGICTSRQKSIDITILTPFPLYKTQLWASEKEFVTKTSDWILQEIGFALGRDMKIMILLESGVRTPGGLQGDIEYIEFDRNSPEQSFNKILEMLRSLTVLPTSMGIIESTKTEKPSEQTATTPATDESQIEKPISEWAIEDYRFNLFVSILGKVTDKEEEIHSSFLKSDFASDKVSLARWNAYRLFTKMEWGKENHLNQLLELMQTNPENADVINYVAKSYELYNEHERAAYYFEKAAAVTENAEDKILRLSHASLAHAKSGENDKAISINKLCLSMVRELGKGLAIIYRSLGDIAQELGNFDDFKVFTEAFLEITPEDHTRRFTLAHRYSEDGEHDSALFHYQILSLRNPDQGNWNNLGVALSNLTLPALSVYAYREAEKLGSTLAMSNLANKLLSAGFLDEAMELANKATAIKNYDERIGSAIASIGEKKEKEEKKRAEHIESFRKVRQFYIDYSRAYLKEDLQSLPLAWQVVWQGSKSKLRASLKQDSFEANGDYEQPTPWIAQKKDGQKQYIKFIGKVNGYCIKYRYWISQQESPNIDSVNPTGSGLMIVDDNLQQIRVYVQGSRDKSSFTEMVAIDDDDTPEGLQ